MDEIKSYNKDKHLTRILRFETDDTKELLKYCKIAMIIKGVAGSVEFVADAIVKEDSYITSTNIIATDNLHEIDLRDNFSLLPIRLTYDTPTNCYHNMGRRANVLYEILLQDGMECAWTYLEEYYYLIFLDKYNTSFKKFIAHSALYE